MADLDGFGLRGLVRGLLATNTTASNTRADQLSQKRFLLLPNTVLSANTSATTLVLPRVDRNIKITAFRVCGSAAQASAAADGWTFAVKYDDGAGGASSTAASFATTATAMVANQTVSGSASTSTADVVAGKRLILVCTAVNTAITANAMTLNAMIEYDET